MDYEKQIENDAEEIINGKGYVVIPNVFTKEEIKEAKDLIDKNMEMLLEEAGKNLQYKVSMMIKKTQLIWFRVKL